MSTVRLAFILTIAKRSRVFRKIAYDGKAMMRV